MAKANSLIRIEGTHGGLTFVKSVAYGYHVRAARGTHKKAVVNAAFKKQSKKLTKANVAAQILKGALDPYRHDFPYGQLWQKLVSVTNDAIGEDGNFDFARLNPFELQPKYPLTRLLSLDTEVEVDSSGSSLNITLSAPMPPDFDDSLPLDGYALQVIVIFPMLEKRTAKTSAVDSSVIGLKQKPGPFVLTWAIPKGAKRFVICVRLNGWESGEVCSALSAKGMRVVAAGKIERSARSRTRK